MPIDENRQFIPINIAIITVSDTRDYLSDKSGDILAQCVSKAGHVLCWRDIVNDDQVNISNAIMQAIQKYKAHCVITTGGTGVTKRDVTPETLHALASKVIPGFGELFRWISFAKIKTSTVQSRACAGIVEGSYVFCLPGSPSACKDAWNEILLTQLDNRFRPCNFIELYERL